MLINTAQMAGLLAYRYMSDQDPYWLDLAIGFADYAVSRQGPDGNYNNYTTVAYPVKSVMTVMAVEEEWPRRRRNSRHLTSAITPPRKRRWIFW